jgi:hypothetical protein
MAIQSVTISIINVSNQRFHYVSTVHIVHGMSCTTFRSLLLTYNTFILLSRNRHAPWEAMTSLYCTHTSVGYICGVNDQASYRDSDTDVNIAGWLRRQTAGQ